MAVFEAMKIPAIVLNVKCSDSSLCYNDSHLAVLCHLPGQCDRGSAVKYYNTIIQCEAGYDTTASKRIEIAEHLRYLRWDILIKTAWDISHL